MREYSIPRRSCITHWPTVVVKYFSAYEQNAPTMAMAKADPAATTSRTCLSSPANDEMARYSQPCDGRPRRTLSSTILSGQGSSRFAIPSPSAARNPSASERECGLSSLAMR